MVLGLPNDYVRVLGGLGSDAWVAFRTERPKAALPSLALQTGWARSARLVDRSATGLLRLRYLEDCLGGVPA